MSPIDFPDLLEKRGDNNKMTEERGRSGGRLIGNLRSRSRSRRSKSAQRRAASQPPKKVHKEDDDDAAKLKKRRSLSRSASRRENKPSDFVELTKKAASPSKRRPTKTSSSGSGNAKTTKSSSSNNKKEWSADIINLVDRDVEDVILSDIILTDKNNKKKNTAGSSKSKSLEKNTKPSSTVKNNSTNTSNNKNEENKKSSLSKTTSSSTAAAVTKPSSTTAVSNKPRKTNSTGSSNSNSNNNTMDKYSGSNHGSPKTVNRFPSDTYSDYETSEDESSDDEEDDDESKSVDAKDLLAQVNARMEQQRLMEEVKELRRVVEKKDAEIEQLTGQLRMAISTKCDLVIAHTELERLHEMDLKARDSYAGEMKRSNLQLMEVRAEVEKEFMNELTQLARKVEESDRRRKEDVQEKDNIIGLLEDKIKRMERNALQGSSARPDTDKVRFYKKKLGVYDQ